MQKGYDSPRMADGRTPSDIILQQLSVYLGPHTAKTAIRTFAQRALGVAPEAVTREQAPRLLDALRPALRTLLGSAKCDVVLADLAQELKS